MISQDFHKAFVGKNELALKFSDGIALSNVECCREFVASYDPRHHVPVRESYGVLEELLV